MASITRKAWPFVLLLLISTVLVADTDEEDVEHRAIAIVTPETTAATLAAVLPPGVTIEDNEEDLYVLRSTQPVDEQLLTALEKLPMIESVVEDSLVEEGGRPLLTAPHVPFTPPAPPSRAGEAAAKKCDLGETCSDGRAKFWAQEAVDAPAMKKRLERNRQSAKVCVVDSGFDRSQEKSFASVGGVRTRRGSNLWGSDPKRPQYGNPDSDESGHGTMVASAIAGKDGLGVAENVSLSVYRATPPGSAGFTSRAKLETSMYRACSENRDPDGITIINLSWGGNDDESGTKRDEKARAVFISRLAARGCLVVKSAGNDTFRRKHRTDDLDDAYLRVAAVDHTRGLSGFSSTGEVSAPGTGVFMVQSSSAKGSVAAENRCKPIDRSSRRPRRFANGTSFAAPIVVGLASQVVRALKAGGKFKGLKPKERIALVNRIIKASEVNGTVNGLRAVAIAERWNKRGGMMPVSALAGLMRSEPERLCAQSPQKCEALFACADVKQCFDTTKQRAALCPDFTATEAASAAKTAFKHGNREAGFGFARLAGKDSETAKTALENYLKHVKSPEKIEVSGLREVVVPYLESCTRAKTCEPALVRRALDGIAKSRKISASARRIINKKTGEDRGARATIAAMKQAYMLAGETLGRQEMLDRIAALSGKTATRAVAARLIDSFLADSGTPKDLADSLRGIETKMHADILRTKEWVPGATYAFDPLIERDLDSLNKAVRAGNLAGLSAMQVQYILRNLDRNPEWKRKKDVLYRNILWRIARGQGWGKVNDYNLKQVARAGLKPKSPTRRYPRSIASVDPE